MIGNDARFSAKHSQRFNPRTAGVVDAAGEFKYTGLHALRHFYASWCASIGLTMKAVQARMGHSNIAVTMDTYTHIFPNAAEVAAAERALMA